LVGKGTVKEYKTLQIIVSFFLSHSTFLVMSKKNGKELGDVWPSAFAKSQRNPL
jgi:hypothetical protein